MATFRESEGRMAGEALALTLICFGGGSVPTQDSAHVSGSQSGMVAGEIYSGDFSGTVTTTSRQGYADQLDIELNGGTGRMRLPRVVLPVVHGGEGGWFEIKNLIVTPTSIDGNAAINFINKPKFHLDRRTGVISISGRNGLFVGQCQKAGEETQF